MQTHVVFMTITIMYLHLWLQLFSNNQEQLLKHIIDEWSTPKHCNSTVFI